MSIREILERLDLDGGVLDNKWEIDKVILAIKDELMRVMPDRLDGLNSMNKGEFYVRGANDFRSQMISAVTKICEEGK